MRHLVLIGYMGSGKSTIGKRVAEVLQMPFVDTDQLIEAVSGRTISDIFATDGEVAFRNMERDTMTTLLAGTPHVISTGGGIPMIDGMMDQLLSQTYVVYLRAKPKTLERRVTGSQNRPLLGSSPALATIESMLEQRSPVYERAHYIIDTDHLTIAQTTQAVIDGWRDRQDTQNNETD